MTFDAPQARDLLDQYWRGKETDDGLAHAVTAALAEIEQLRNALKPFAEAWNAAGARVDLCATADDITDQATAALTSFHFIKACAALETSAAPEPTLPPLGLTIEEATQRINAAIRALTGGNAND